MASTNPATGRTDDDRAVRAVLSNIYAAWAANDAGAFAALYVEDATSVLPGTYNTNRDDIRRYMAAGFAGPLKGSSVISEVLNGKAA